MDTTILKKGFQSSSRRITALYDGITETEASFRPYDKANSLVWELGHITASRNSILKALNPTEVLELYPNENQLFGYGSKPVDASQYPALSELLTVFNKRGERMNELIGTLTAEQIASESPLKIPGFGTTVGQHLFSFLIHEANHWGEMNIIKTLVTRLREV